MTEHEVFEARLRTALDRYVADGPTDFDAREFARTVAAAEPRRRGRTGAIAAVLQGWPGRGHRRWPPALVWALLLAGLLLALVSGSLLVGAWRPDRAVVVVPLPSPTHAATLMTEGTGILATTRAKPLPAQATCPPGSDPDTPGPTNAERQAGRFGEYGAMAFDRHAGRIVVLGGDEQLRPRTWTFDVCTNTWERMNPPEEPPMDDPVALVYDADSDRTLAFASDKRVWSYDLSADRWTKEGLYPEVGDKLVGWVGGVAAVYHDPSGLVIVYGGQSMWAYDVETDTMTPIRRQTTPQPAGSGVPRGVTAVVYDRGRDLVLAAAAIPDELRNSGFYIAESKAYEAWVEDGVLEIWAFDPGTGSWRPEPSQVPARILWQHDGYFFGPVGRAAFDEASGVTVFISENGWVEAYDGLWNWRASPDGGSMPPWTGDGWCDSVNPVYEPLGGRIVCQVGGGGVSAFSTATGQWRWLVEPGPSSAQ